MTTSSTPSYTGRFFFVRSSQPNLFYRIGIDNRTGLYTCECADYSYRHRDCKHIRAHQAGKSIEARPVRPRPVPVRVQPSRPITTADVDELYGEPATVRRGRDLVMAGLREPAA